jgi:glucosamine-6-phosphate deaminase
MKTTKYGQAQVSIGADAEEIGRAAGEDFAAAANALLATREEIAVIFATGNSQATFHDAIAARTDIDWSRISLLHLDEYVGVPDSIPESTAWRMRTAVADRVHPRAFYGFHGDNDPEAEALRYAELVERLAPAICVMGIGENGHMAFNDPGSDFETDLLVEIVTLSEGSKRQILGEGRFTDIDEVPKTAVTLTIPALIAPEHVIVVVPDARKAEAVKAALEGPISQDCPGSILQEVPQARIYLDAASAHLLAPR